MNQDNLVLKTLIQRWQDREILSLIVYRQAHPVKRWEIQSCLPFRVKALYPIDCEVFNGTSKGSPGLQVCAAIFILKDKVLGPDNVLIERGCPGHKLHRPGYPVTQ